MKNIQMFKTLLTDPKYTRVYKTKRYTLKTCTISLVQAKKPYYHMEKLPSLFLNINRRIILSHNFWNYIFERFKLYELIILLSGKVCEVYWKIFNTLSTDPDYIIIFINPNFNDLRPVPSLILQSITIQYHRSKVPPQFFNINRRVT